ncbi:MAG: tRNA 2-thiocytidine(32) synthetase TtcA [Oscillospiraceae bacterium]|nr:tRNA 2-thiocytidine(32) synthetase TtcA [Oscillospiraceae bacterium]
MQRLLSYVRSAVSDYDMIAEGDKIAVGLSGGKDSVAMLKAFSELRRFYPNRFELAAITVDMGFNTDFTVLEQLCEKINVPYYIKKTDIGPVIFDIRREENPCALCSRMRRGALHDAAVAEGYTKLALGHHWDDVIETLFLNLFYEGRIGCFKPVTYLDRKQITVIRPLIYASEAYISSFIQRQGLPVVKNLCPADKNTSRQQIKELVYKLDKEYHGLKTRVFGALQRSGIDGWHPHIHRRR